VTPNYFNLLVDNISNEEIPGVIRTCTPSPRTKKVLREQNYRVGLKNHALETNLVKVERD